jgi:hypothetical protein
MLLSISDGLYGYLGHAAVAAIGSRHLRDACPELSSAHACLAVPKDGASQVLVLEPSSIHTKHRHALGVPSASARRRSGSAQTEQVSYRASNHVHRVASQPGPVLSCVRRRPKTGEDGAGARARGGIGSIQRETHSCVLGSYRIFSVVLVAMAYPPDAGWADEASRPKRCITYMVEQVGNPASSPPKPSEQHVDSVRSRDEHLCMPSSSTRPLRRSMMHDCPTRPTPWDTSTGIMRLRSILGCRVESSLLCILRVCPY